MRIPLPHLGDQLKRDQWFKLSSKKDPNKPLGEVHLSLLFTYRTKLQFSPLLPPEPIILAPNLHSSYRGLLFLLIQYENQNLKEEIKPLSPFVNALLNDFALSKDSSKGY